MKNELEIPALVTASVFSLKWLEGWLGVVLTLILIAYTLITNPFLS